MVWVKGLFLGAVFIGVGAGCQSSQTFMTSEGVIENDELPLLEPYFATAQLLGHKVKDPTFHSSEKTFDISAPGRPSKLRVVLWTHEKETQERTEEDPRDLFVLLPGFGGTPHNSSLLRTFAHRLWLQGFDVLSIPSTTSVPGQAYFLDRESPGNISQTEASLLNSLESIVRKVRPDAGQVHLAGMSWGAMQSLRLARLIAHKERAPDQNSEEINWGIFLAIAPPVDLSYSFTQLDKMYWGRRDLYENTGQPNAILQNKLRASVDSRLNTAERLDLFESSEIEYLLAFSFYQSLRQITPPLGRPRVSFDQYIRAPWGLRLTTPEQFQQWKSNVHLMRVLQDPYFPKERSLVFHSTDDFINAPNSAQTLKQALGSQMILYRRGGHLGFMNSVRFEKDLARSLKPLSHAQRAQ